MPRISVVLRGTVQGVGLRPHVLRVASSLGLSGSVSNAGGQVEIEAQGSPSALQRFVDQLARIAPPARLLEIERSELPEVDGAVGFRILESSASVVMPALPPDLAPCLECVAEVEAAAGRRAGYPFTACTRCGARYSIVRALPYDRAGTTLAAFPPCAECAREYEDVADRRFHAQAIACPSCGPELEQLDHGAEPLCRAGAALQAAVETLQRGGILALKGVGGFQLLVDALDDTAVRRLRARKRREEKPFAVLFGSFEELAGYVHVTEAERALLEGSEAPIVLLERRAGPRRIAEAVAPDNPLLGCMLPASPLHRLLGRSAARPLVCTSGNASGEPLCTDNAEALSRLSQLAEARGHRVYNAGQVPANDGGIAAGQAVVAADSA